MFLVAVHFAVCKLAVDFRAQAAVLLASGVPLPFTALLHRRFRLSWIAATMLHYPLAIMWAFCFGVTYSIYRNSVTHAWYERETVGIEAPIEFGLSAAAGMALVGIPMAGLYGILAKLVIDWWVRRNRGPLVDMSDYAGDAAKDWPTALAWIVCLTFAACVLALLGIVVMASVTTVLAR